MAHEGLWEQLEKLQPQATARRAKCNYEKSPQNENSDIQGRYVVTFLNCEYVVEPASRRIFTTGPKAEHKDAGFLEQLCILAYLINARQIPLAQKIVGATALKGGQFFFRGLHSLPTDKLAKAFGQNPEQLYRAAGQFNAKLSNFGDAAVELPLLPRVPVILVIWRGDDEFSSRASILFDRTAATQLPLDALLAAVNLAVNAVIEAAEKNS